MLRVEIAPGFRAKPGEVRPAKRASATEIVAATRGQLARPAKLAGVANALAIACAPMLATLVYVKSRPPAQIAHVALARAPQLAPARPAAPANIARSGIDFTVTGVMTPSAPEAHTQERRPAKAKPRLKTTPALR